MDNDFLPLKINGEYTYAGFWDRFGAAIGDTIVLIPFALGLFYLQFLGIWFAIVGSVIIATLFSAYNVYFNAKYGGTLGKLAVGIRVTKPDGSKIGLKQAWYRSSVDICFAVLFLIFEIYGLFSVNWGEYSNADFSKRMDLLIAVDHPMHYVVDSANNIWVWGELLVLLFNKRKRAIHDYIAETVVINKKFSTS